MPLAVKAQIHAGGRGKGGGIKLAHTLAELAAVAAKILGMTLVTPQTGAKGQKVRKILVEQGVAIKQEYYLSLVPDRLTATIAVMASRAGGMDIEEVARQTPEKITTININPLAGIQPHHCQRVAAALSLPAEALPHFERLLPRLYRLFTEKDCSLLEINPLVLCDSNELMALDAKIVFDDSALFRHQDLLELYDAAEDEPLEVEAKGFGLNYIKLDGNVGNMVNGAGLAMATMDLIKSAGAAPANFLDVGGGASAAMVEKGFEIILKDRNVKAILVNIFGGILRCDVLAQGIVQAAKTSHIAVPVVVRMEGTNVEQGRKILAASGLDLITAVDLQDAAQQIAAIVGETN
jgi:succinyl-CoA synthetase beta subunit